MNTRVEIDKRSLDRQAADWIRDAIFSGDLAPGSRLTEISLATQIGLSRSTVRAGMQRLANEGLLIQHAYTGWEVVSLSAEDAWELYTLRSNLEGMAARLAAARIDEAGRARLLNALADLKSAIGDKDPRRIAQADLAFHKTVVALSGHRRLIVQYGLISDPVLLYILLTTKLMEYSQAIYDEHEQMAAAILSGDAAQAEKLVCDSAQMHGERLVKTLQAQSEVQAA
ncbi:HTH-type transcriptional repressor CsiR [compost metagenome]|jgi:DNA-binding GntR family transcriptional regulator|uniref:GntR family transcriptional regulator n=1 Tax=Cupriavidus campinensis TaxID=151783 RepID=A0AAE9L504_9BURK|nr:MULTISPECIES: GntR family transcriptional regulator [Cupriavidus]URF07453.1 GntR family transcriptional regulator [Cupriavidus campinensis]CAG2139424.1 putative D-xylose utilization operon transcriptional repressor [Cupriavidus campinensis]